MEKDKLKQLKKEYKDISIPEELDFVVRKAFKNKGVTNMARKNNLKKFEIIAASLAIALGVFTAGINASPVFAQTLSDVPIVGNLVKVLTIREYSVKEEKFNADIKVPAVQGLENKELENSINQKYLDENKKLYEQFMKNMGEMKEKNGGNMGVDSGYEVKTDNDTILSIGRWVVETAGDSYETVKYDTIDKKNEVLLTLPSLFKDDSYVEVISENIIKQMRTQMKADEGKSYWIDENAFIPEEAFKQIEKNQNFYINKDGKLVISFNEFDVAPGCMGTPEFVIPTEELAGILVGNEYIK